jgi:hypothetical protein
MTNEQVTGGAQWMRLDPYCSRVTQLVVIVDTNALLSSILHDYRRGQPSRLRKMTALGTSVLCAADHVFSEVYEHLPVFSAAKGVSLAELRTRWEEDYLSILRFVTVADEDIVDPQVLAITDPDDVPTGQLAKLVGPCVVFSDDKHLRRPGLAVSNWPQVAGHAVDLAEGTSTQNVAGNLMISRGWAATELIKLLGRKLGVSPWLVGGIVVAGTTLLLMNPERRTRFGRMLERYGIPILQGLTEMVSEAQVQKQCGIEGLRDVILAVPSELSVKQQVAIILARQTEPLLAKEIHEQIELHFPPERIPTVTEVRTILRSNPEFVVYRRYRWSFGGYLPPLAADIGATVERTNPHSA